MDFDLSKSKIRHVVRILLDTRDGKMWEPIDVVCVRNGSVSDRDVETYALRKLHKKYKIDDFMRLDSVAEIIESTVINK